MVPFDDTFPFGHEEALWPSFARIAGVDEAGRGPLAGPVVAAAVIFTERRCPDGVADSKALNAAQREAAYDRIVACAHWAVGIAEADEIDRLNILRATHEAMRRALAALEPCAHYILVDGLAVPHLPAPSRNLVKGERRSASIAAASVIAKVTRDRLMTALHDEYPGYNFARHKGYGTPEHLRALAEHGPCPQHRVSFSPVRAAASCGFRVAGSALRAGKPSE